MSSMSDLIYHFLQDIYYAEKQGVKLAPKLAKHAENGDLKAAFLQHRDTTRDQVARLDTVFRAFGKRARPVQCEAFEGLSKEAEEATDEFEKGPALDSALLATAQAIMHYEMARYGALLAWARADGNEQAAELLEQTLEEERQADQRLSEIAERVLNPQVEEEGEEDEDQKEEEEEEKAPEPPEPAPPKRRGRAKAEPKPEPAPTPEVPEPDEGEPKSAAKKPAGKRAAPAKAAPPKPKPKRGAKK